MIIILTEGRMKNMSVKSQKKNMEVIFALVNQDLSYIHGERESGPNGAKKQFHSKSAAFLRSLGNDLGLKEFKVSKNYGGIAVSGEITLIGMWDDGSGLHFQICQPFASQPSFLYRTISHMKDFRGEQNRWLPISMFGDGDYEGVLGLLLALHKPTETGTATTKIPSADTRSEAKVVNRDAA